MRCDGQEIECCTICDPPRGILLGIGIGPRQSLIVGVSLRYPDLSWSQPQFLRLSLN